MAKNFPTFPLYRIYYYSIDVIEGYKVLKRLETLSINIREVPREISIGHNPNLSFHSIQQSSHSLYIIHYNKQNICYEVYD